MILNTVKVVVRNSHFPVVKLCRNISSLRLKPNLYTMKLDTPLFKSLFTPEINSLVALFEKYGYEMRIAGGAVRDLLMDKPPADVDFATTATPDEMKEMFTKEEIRMINNKGEKHGTITARINDKENFEVTTLRIDVATDGRHAEVEFTKDWVLDANRRDLTINAMFLGFDGTLYDYFNGKKDLDARQIKFVGNANERIQEDYLRILRYFRFYGRISAVPSNHDSETLEAIKANMDGLKGISGERIWMELKKILAGRFAADIVEIMFSLGMTSYIGFPDNLDFAEFRKVCKRSEELSPLPMTRLSALLTEEKQVYDVTKRLKLSNDEIKLAVLIMKLRDEDFGDEPFKYFANVVFDLPGNHVKVKERLTELIKYKGDKSVLTQFQEWSAPKFPLSGHTIVERGVPKGPVFAKVYNDCRLIWKESEFKMPEEELLVKLDEVLKKMGL